MRGRTGSEQLEFQQSKDKTAARANSPSLSFLWTPRSIFLPGAPCFCGGCESSWTPCPPRQNLPDLPPAARKRPRGLRSSRSPWGGSSHLLLSFLFMLPGGEGGSYKSEARLLPPHHCSSFLAPWELGPPRCLGRKEELPLPTQPQARASQPGIKVMSHAGEAKSLNHRTAIGVSGWWFCASGGSRLTGAGDELSLGNVPPFFQNVHTIC